MNFSNRNRNEPSVVPNPSRALVVDDNLDSAQAFGCFLESQNYEVQIAGDGMEALRMAVTFQPQLVLMDIQMPKLDGYDTCRVIRAQPWGHSTFLIAITGLPVEAVRSRSAAVGFDTYLMKPVSYENLQAVLAVVKPRL